MRDFFDLTPRRYGLTDFNDWLKPSLMNYEKGEMSRFSPTLDIEENDERFLMTVDLPGMKEEDIDLSVDEDTLTISGKRERKFSSDEANVTRTERHYGEFWRSFSLPQNVNGEEIVAEYNQGVLEIVLPKTKKIEKKNRKIALRSKESEGTHQAKGSSARH